MMTDYEINEEIIRLLYEGNNLNFNKLMQGVKGSKITSTIVPKITC